MRFLACDDIHDFDILNIQEVGPFDLDMVYELLQKLNHERGFKYQVDISPMI